MTARLARCDLAVRRRGHRTPAQAPPTKGERRGHDSRRARRCLAAPTSPDRSDHRGIGADGSEWQFNPAARQEQLLQDAGGVAGRRGHRVAALRQARSRRERQGRRRWRIGPPLRHVCRRRRLVGGAAARGQTILTRDRGGAQRGVAHRDAGGAQGAGRCLRLNRRRRPSRVGGAARSAAPSDWRAASALGRQRDDPGFARKRRHGGCAAAGRAGGPGNGPVRRACSRTDLVVRTCHRSRSRRYPSQC